MEKAYTKWRLFFRKLIQAVGRFEAKQIINYKLKFFSILYFFLTILARFKKKSTDQCRRCHTFIMESVESAKHDLAYINVSRNVYS